MISDKLKKSSWYLSSLINWRRYCTELLEDPEAPVNERSLSGLYGYLKRQGYEISPADRLAIFTRLEAQISKPGPGNLRSKEAIAGEIEARTKAESVRALFKSLDPERGKSLIEILDKTISKGKAKISELEAEIERRKQEAIKKQKEEEAEAAKPEEPEEAPDLSRKPWLRTPYKD